MYQRAFSTLGCPDASLEEAASLASQFRIPQLELRAVAGSLDLPAHFQERFGAPPALGAAMKGRGSVVALDTSFRLMVDGEEQRAQLAAFGPWAEALGARWLRVFDGGEKLDESGMSRAAENLRWWQAFRKERGWKADLMIETHDVLLDAPTIERFFAAMPTGTWLLWDAHHTWKRGGEDLLETWRRIRPHVAHLHVKDSVSRPNPSGQFPYTYVLPGQGEFPFAPLRVLLEREFSGSVSLEWERRWHPYLPPLADALRSANERGWW